VGPQQRVGEGVERRDLRHQPAPTRATTRSRTAAAARPKVSTSTSSARAAPAVPGAAPSLAATASTTVVVLPVPGPASTSSGPPTWSTTLCWAWSSAAGSAATTGVRSSRRRGAMAVIPADRSDTAAGGGPSERWPGQGPPGPDQRARARSTRRPSALIGCAPCEAPQCLGLVRGRPSARLTRCHGTPPPNLAMTVPTAGPPSRAFATSPYVTGARAARGPRGRAPARRRLGSTPPSD
jgi:hypothetical protein